MHKKIILKYFTEFTAWCNDQEVYVMFSNGGHRLVDSVDDFNEDVKYIILKDSYFIYRKAQAEGKTIQQSTFSNGSLMPTGWVDRDECNFTHPIERYRVKPKLEFKVGDYVYHLTRKDIIKVTPTHLVHDTEHMKLWTLEEASDDDWLVCLRPASVPVLITKKEFNIQKDNFLVFESVVPYIQQSIKELGL